ncbi:MAG: GrpB family protein [Hydrogenophaga sp.]|uniref:GrpB family protein n=1 Tax=Hydrogenophaga sp. TaxID=1904254 RepID=UPI0025C3C509|nr:GrpB family protein [Hydrogenophaga sp.]MBT9552657.1 GrpB family protein [Hydrogenophaga sp.]
MNEHESLVAAIYEEVKLHAYDPSWPVAYATERERLLSVLPGVFLDVQHIGSTAVPGLAAKPIIDILAGVESMAVAESVTALLCASGYTTSAEFNETLRDRKWFMRWANGHRTHHLHVVVHGGQVWHERLRFRDALCSNPVLAARYAELKAESAEKHPTDRDAYTDAKAEFVRSVSRAA